MCNTSTEEDTLSAEQGVVQGVDTGSAQSLLLSLFGLFVFDVPARSVIATQLAITVLAQVGVSESSTRMTLNRMVKRGLLNRVRAGRTSSFGLAAEGRALLARGRERMFDPHPFNLGSSAWTLLNATPPGTPASARYQFETRLSWAGFAAIDSRLWIAPGKVDLQAVLGDLLPAQSLAELRVFHSVTAAPTQVESLVSKAWDVPAIRAAHVRFLDLWESVPASTEPSLASLIRLAESWAQLLRSDPGLPGAVLDENWPAQRSVATFQRLFGAWKERANLQLDAFEAAQAE